MVCLRGGEFARAEEVLLRHFSDAADSAGKKKLFESLIRRRRSSHSVLQLSSYADFKQDMLDFIERQYRVPEPFLLQMLKRSGHPGVSSEPVTSSSQDRQKTSAAAEDHGSVSARLSLRSLRQVYGVLSERYGVSVSFTQLEQELEEEEEEEQEEESPELHLALSETQPETAYAAMTISRLVQEDDSQLSAEEEEEETQIRIVVPSGPDSDDPEVQTPVRRSDTQNSECSSAQICTPARHTQKRNRILLSSDVESEDPAASPPASRRSSRHKQQQKKSDLSVGESAPVSTPARPSSPASVTRSDRDTQNQSSEMEVEDGGSSVQHSTPARPSATDAPRQNRSVTVSSESEDHSSSPAAQTSRRRSSPSSGGAHSRRRARWQDVSGTHENWSDEESLFSATSGAHTSRAILVSIITIAIDDKALLCGDILMIVCFVLVFFIFCVVLFTLILATLN
uniref:Telomeric repeat-binding factor 2-like n=1 Tax=Sinocyclocheilus grahami TaxID=75366 RepID=A0A672LGC7_SINGR